MKIFNKIYRNQIQKVKPKIIIHIEIIMPRVIRVDDEFLGQLSVRVEQNVLRIYNNYWKLFAVSCENLSVPREKILKERELADC